MVTKLRRGWAVAILILSMFIVGAALAPGAYAASVSAKIQDVKVSYATDLAGVLGPGLPVTVVVKVKNTGSQGYTFWVGLSFKDGNGIVYDVSPQSISLGKGKTGSVTFRWTVDYYVSSGSLSTTVAVWKGYSGGYMQGELARWGWKVIGTVP